MTTRYLALVDIAEISGEPLERLKSRVRTGRFPDPDGIVGRGPHQRQRLGWLPESVAEYLPEGFSLE